MKEGYQSIGSFHSENLISMMQVSPKGYIPPSIPFGDELEISFTTASNPVSHQAIVSSFVLDIPHWTFLNHGAFGAGLRVGLDRAAQWRRYLDQQPLRFFDRDLLPHLAHATRIMAEFIHLPHKQWNCITLIPNTTYGMNSIMSSYARHYQMNGRVLVWDTTYGSVKKMARHYYRDSVLEIPLQQHYLQQLASIRDPELVLQQALEDTLSRVPAPDRDEPILFIIDHVSSNTAITFPIETLARQIKDWNANATVLVDGAHGLLAHAIDMNDMPSVDFYISNCHKWLSAPRGAAMMVVPEYNDRWKDILYPAVMSHGGDEDDLLSRFIWDGTRDYAAQLALPVVIEYWNAKGPDTVRQQIRQGLQDGIQILVQHWYPDLVDERESWSGSILLAYLHSSVLSSPMILVKLPSSCKFENREATSTDAKTIQDYLFAHRIEVPIKCIQGELFVRLSCHIYNHADDFDVLGRAILKYPC